MEQKAKRKHELQMLEQKRIEKREKKEINYFLKKKKPREMWRLLEGMMTISNIL